MKLAAHVHPKGSGRHIKCSRQAISEFPLLHVSWLSWPNQFLPRTANIFNSEIKISPLKIVFLKSRSFLVIHRNGRFFYTGTRTVLWFQHFQVILFGFCHYTSVYWALHTLSTILCPLNKHFQSQVHRENLYHFIWGHTMPSGMTISMSISVVARPPQGQIS